MLKAIGCKYYLQGLQSTESNIHHGQVFYSKTQESTDYYMDYRLYKERKVTAYIMQTLAKANPVEKATKNFQSRCTI